MSWGSLASGSYGVAGGNAVGAIRTSTMLGDRYVAYDRLPAPVREALQQAVVDQCPMTIRTHYQRIADLVDEAEAARLYVPCLQQAEAEEIERHSLRYQVINRQPAPHVAAEASVLRSYGTPAPVRRHPRRA